jgi:hypothetical protein
MRPDPAIIASRYLFARDKIALRVQQLKKLLESPVKEFGVLTSELGDMGAGEKTDAKTSLVTDLMKMGYPKTIPLKASWEGTKERSLLIPGMTFDDAIAMGRKYKQDAVIYKHPSGTLGAYFPTKNKVIVATKPDGEISAEISANPDLYSKGRGISFSFDLLWSQEIPWNMSRPATKDDVLGFIANGQIQF